MSRKSLYLGLRSAALAVLAASAATLPVAALADNAVTAGGVTLINKGLVGVGRIPANQRDKFGETFGSGSGMSIDPSSWTRDGNGYKGTLWLLPDRGYNVVGTTDYRPRLNTLAIQFSPVAPGATPSLPIRCFWLTTRVVI